MSENPNPAKESENIAPHRITLTPVEAKEFSALLHTEEVQGIVDGIPPDATVDTIKARLSKVKLTGPDASKTERFGRWVTLELLKERNSDALSEAQKVDFERRWDAFENWQKRNPSCDPQSDAWTDALEEHAPSNPDEHTLFYKWVALKQMELGRDKSTGSRGHG